MSEFDALLGHLRDACDDAEGVISIRQVKRKLKEDIVDIIRQLMDYAEASALQLPMGEYQGIMPGGLEEVDSAVLHRTGILTVKPKKGSPVLIDIVNEPAESVIKIFNISIPILREEMAKKKRQLERNLESLQAIKSSLAKIEKRRQATKPASG